MDQEGDKIFEHKCKVVKLEHSNMDKNKIRWCSEMQAIYGTWKNYVQ